MTTLEAIAAHGLRSRHELPAATLEVDAASVLLIAAESHRLLGLLSAAVRDGSLVLPDASIAQLEPMERGWLAHDLRLERLLFRARARLRTSGIESRVLKGAALAHTVYREPSMRVFGDVDLLVPAGQVTDAVQVLEDELATTRVQPELRPGFDERFGKEVMLRTNGLELDLHRIFVEGAFGLSIDTDELFAPPYRFAMGGEDLEALPMPQRLLHACYAAVLGDWPPRLISLRDVAQLVLHERPNLTDVLLMARHWRCEAVVARAVVTAWSQLALVDRPPIVEWAHRYVPSRRDRLLLAAHEGPARAFTRHVAALGVLHSARDRFAYATAIALPQPEYLRARGMTAGSHVGRAWRRVRA